MAISEELLTEAMKLKPFERLLFIQTLNKSLDVPDLSISKIWEKEINERVLSYESGSLPSISLNDFIAQ